MRQSSLLVLSLLAATLSCTSPGPRHDAVESYVQTPDGSLLHYRKLGTGASVLLVPGESWLSPDADRLAEGRTLIFYDARRRGLSGKASTARMDQDLADLETVRASLGLERFSLLGWDYYGALCARYAAENPERVERLVLISPIPARKFPYWKVYDRILHDRIDNKAFAELRDPKGKLKDRTAWAEAYKDSVLSAMVVRASALKKMEATPLIEPNLDPRPILRQYVGLLNALGEWDWRDELALIQAPTLVVYGDSDPVPAASLQEWPTSIPGAAGAPIGNCGRLPWIEKPDDFYAAVEPFLAPAMD